MKKSITIFSLLLLLGLSNTAEAQDPFIGEIRIFAGNFAPRGWAFCDGQLLSISSNSALFSILGTTYGGDGRTTFALPDLRGRAPIHAGHGAGLTNRVLGSKTGTEQTTITILNLPNHSHSASLTGSTASVSIPVNVSDGDADETNPGSGVLANTGDDLYASSPSTGSQYSGAPVQADVNGNVTIGSTGAEQPFNNMQPVLTVHYIIALEGTYPSRS